MTDSPHFRRRDYLAPRHWPVWLGLGMLRVLVALPLPLQVRIGGALGRALGRLVGRRRQVAAANIELCFPQLSTNEKRRLLRAHLAALGQGLIELAMTWWAGDARLRRLSRVEGLENLAAALAQGRGVILLTGHFTCMEIASHMLALRAPYHAMYRRQSMALVDALVRRARESRSPRVFVREDPRSMIRSLREGAAVWYAPDQNYGAQHAVFVDFFGVPAATITTTSRFARSTGAAVVPYFPRRLPGAQGYVIEVLPALEGFPSGDDAADTRRINALLETQIAKAPEQYLWAHRRFKTRPPDMPDPYRSRPDWL